MTTLTKRLRELEIQEIDYKAGGCYPNSALPLAQELHALLVECGEALETCGCEPLENILFYDYAKVEPALTKLKQAGIV